MKSSSASLQIAGESHSDGAVAPTTADPRLLDGKYRLEEEVGSGGSSIVWRAHDTRHDRPVAVKILRHEVAAMIGTRRFLWEIRIAARLSHPHIVPLFDSGLCSGRPFYVMPLIEGPTLRELISRKRLTVDQVMSLAGDVSECLEYAHDHSVIHRDVKPSNIMLVRSTAMLCDFGVARALDSSSTGPRITATGLTLGSPAYMSPEQICGCERVDGRTDVFSLAVVLYEGLTGAHPFAAESTRSMIARTLIEEPEPVRMRRADCPEPIDTAILRALSKEPSERFGSMGAFLRALQGSARSWH